MRNVQIFEGALNFNVVNNSAQMIFLSEQRIVYEISTTSNKKEGSEMFYIRLTSFPKVIKPSTTFNFFFNLYDAQIIRDYWKFFFREPAQVEPSGAEPTGSSTFRGFHGSSIPDRNSSEEIRSFPIVSRRKTVEHHGKKT
jgi:hypothetical protein